MNDPYELLIKDRNRSDIVLAELSARNWIWAISFEIQKEYGSSVDEWKTTLGSHFKHNGKPKKKVSDNTNEISSILRSYFYSLCLINSIYERTQAVYSPFNTVGGISDFYYCMLNLFSVFAIDQNGKSGDTHQQAQKIFKSYKEMLPHPFNIYTVFDSRLWNGSKLIDCNCFNASIPKLGVFSSTSSSSQINKIHTSMSASISSDILLGKLRGDTAFEIDRIKENTKEHLKIKDFLKKENKSKVNAIIQCCEPNFLLSLYRFRTKAHYRDFLFLTLECEYTSATTYYSNNKIDNVFWKELLTVSEFLSFTVFKYLEKRWEKDLIISFFEMVSKKTTQPAKYKFWESYL